jgi:ferricrocin synthase
MYNASVISCIKHPASSPYDIDFQSETLIPLSPDRLKIPTVRSNGSPSVTPSTRFSTTELMIINILSTFSDVPERVISKDTTVYHLGIDSISAIQLASKLSKRAGKRCLASDILRNPRLSDLAAFIERPENRQDSLHQTYDFLAFQKQNLMQLTKNLELRPETIHVIRPCTPLQEGLIAQFLQGTGTYVNFMSYKLNSEIKIRRMVNALLEVANRNAILRTGFAEVDHPKHEYAMVIHREIPSTVIEALSSEDLSLTKDLGQWRENAVSEISEALHLPTWRALVVPSDGGILLHFAIFHAVYDAQSLQLVLNELSSIYNRQQLDVPLPLDPMIDVILSLGATRDAETFWRSQLGEGMMGESLTNKFPDLAVLRTNIAAKEVCEQTCSIPLKDLESHCRVGGFSLQAAGQAAWARILSSYLSEPIVTFGTVLSGRDALPGYEKVMFPCIVTIPTPVRTGPNTQRVLNSVMEFNSEVRRFQFSSLRDIARWSGRPNETLFDTIFSFRKFSDARPALDWKLHEDIATDEVCESD